MPSLPPKDDPVGLMIRLLIAESRTPGGGAYDEAEVASGMQEMKATLDGRLNNPRDFCAAGATDAIGIITAVCPGGGHQFAGFALVGGAVQIDPSIQSRIDACLQRADDGDADYQAFVQHAIDAANGTGSKFSELTEIDGVSVEPGCFGWRTAGHGGPGGRFIAIPAAMGGVIAGNQFFTLKA